MAVVVATRVRHCFVLPCLLLLPPVCLYHLAAVTPPSARSLQRRHLTTPYITLYHHSNVIQIACLVVTCNTLIFTLLNTSNTLLLHLLNIPLLKFPHLIKERPKVPLENDYHYYYYFYY